MAKQKASKPFDLHSQAGVAALLRQVRSSTLPASTKTTIRELVLQYTQRGGDPAVRDELEQTLAGITLVPSARTKRDAESEVHNTNEEQVAESTNLMSTQPKIVMPVRTGYAGGRPVPSFGNKKHPVTESVPTPAEVVPEPSEKPASQAPTTPIPEEPSTVTAPSPVETQTEKNIESAPISQTVTVTDNAARIQEIKREVIALVGNPINLIDIDNTIGKQYMTALLEAMKKSNSGTKQQAADAMTTLESSFAAVQAVVRNRAANPITATAAEVPAHTPAAPEPPKKTVSSDPIPEVSSATADPSIFERSTKETDDMPLHASFIPRKLEVTADSDSEKIQNVAATETIKHTTPEINLPERKVKESAAAPVAEPNSSEELPTEEIFSVQGVAPETRPPQPPKPKQRDAGLPRQALGGTPLRDFPSHPYRAIERPTPPPAPRAVQQVAVETGKQQPVKETTVPVVSVQETTQTPVQPHDQIRKVQSEPQSVPNKKVMTPTQPESISPVDSGPISNLQNETSTQQEVVSKPEAAAGMQNVPNYDSTKSVAPMTELQQEAARTQHHESIDPTFVVPETMHSASAAELMNPKVTQGLEQLLSEWSIFKHSGIFGMGPSGIDHPLFQSLKNQSMLAIMNSTFQGSTPEIQQSIKDYLNGWRYEQAIMPQHTETFEHFLRRVVWKILQHAKH